MNDITTGVLVPVAKELFSHITNSMAAVCTICCCGIISVVVLTAIDKKAANGNSPETASDKGR